MMHSRHGVMTDCAQTRRKTAPSSDFHACIQIFRLHAGDEGVPSDTKPCETADARSSASRSTESRAIH